MTMPLLPTNGQVDASPRVNWSTVYGTSGLKQQSGYIREEYLRELYGHRWFKVVSEMMDYPIVRGAYLAIENLMRGASREVQPVEGVPTSEQDAEFIDGALFGDMRPSWPDTVSELATFLAYGWSAPEMTFKRRNGENDDPLKSSNFDDGLIGWAGWQGRAQDTLLRWQFEQGSNRAVAFEQQTIYDAQLRVVPLQKCVHVRTSSRKDNPEGISIFRAAYRSHYFARNIENNEGIGIDRDLTGIPKIFLDPKIMAGAPGSVEAQAYDYYKEMGTNVRNDEQAVIILPSVFDANGNRLIDFELLGTRAQRLIDTGAVIQRKQVEMAWAFLADWLILGHQKVGTFALALSKTDLFTAIVKAWLTMIEDVVNDHAIPTLMKLNGWRRPAYPRLSFGDVGKADIISLGNYVANLAKAGGSLWSVDAEGKDPLLTYLLDAAGLPPPEVTTLQPAPERVRPDQIQQPEEEMGTMPDSTDGDEQSQQVAA